MSKNPIKFKKQSRFNLYQGEMLELTLIIDNKLSDEEKIQYTYESKALDEDLTRHEV